MKVAVVGTGVIGASWTTLFLLHGHEVVASDPAPGAEQRLRAAVAADQRRLSFTSDLAEAVAGADFVQENGPERPHLKDELFAVLDAAAPPGTVLASSSSGLLPSRIQQACAAHPERVLVGHPFNPPHLIPLVEVVPGERTDEAAVEAAMAFYRSLGRRPIRLRQEIPGHVANRLQAALWREAYSLIERGAASVADIDAAIAHGPGLRWALLGPFLNQHLSGGPGGITHVLEHLGPPMEEWWADLGTPRLTPELTRAIASGVAEELAGTAEADLLAERDALLSLLLDAKNRTDHL
ncbi:3-hydroxyacyl-CoA dehydrogenase [Kitasatospora sp. MMS16-BH015]|uniref:3-hydroxyacyl-CoA dehydrogenase NAD-binding domain-containing protein n=1 Tax=Kitasatospora sp. MMS16-BH015 TaxID=2018025 RepID=UPI000CA3C200|nr:3-hydroxyacyl-CoA dehydrogenase NAD-binding domain-containing protein [Kitasatospora sp. MMS16-BH015]AUG75413.1 3-hydroxyacyl-CoA dehydrogenase [Kitasatospora sp. MMS16-BH015]